MQWFVDETKARGYLIAATLVDVARLAEVRRTLRLALPKGQRRIHMVDEADPLRRKFLGVLEEAALEARLYLASDVFDTDVRWRRACLRGLVSDAVEQGCTRLTLETDPTQDARDRQTLIEATRELDRRRAFAYDHVRAYDEPLLWASDAIAWAHARGGPWREMTIGIVSAVVHV